VFIPASQQRPRTYGSAGGVIVRTGNENARNGRAIATFFIIDISSSSKNKSLIILACQIVLQIDIRSGNQIILSDRKALLGSRVAFIFDRGWVRV
jgi:hypothetical protein